MRQKGKWKVCVVAIGWMDICTPRYRKPSKFAGLTYCCYTHYV